MGYCTTYELTWELTKGAKLPLANCLHINPAGVKFCGECGKPVTEIETPQVYIQMREDLNYALGDTGKNGETCKWYEHEKDMKVMSERFPEYLFELHGEGEESGDIWNKYFLNGKMQVSKAKVTFEPFDKAKLK